MKFQKKGHSNVYLKLARCLKLYNKKICFLNYQHLCIERVTISLNDCIFSLNIRMVIKFQIINTKKMLKEVTLCDVNVIVKS